MLTLYFDSQEEHIHWHVLCKDGHSIIQQAMKSVDTEGQRYVSFLWEPNQERIFTHAIIRVLYTFFSSYHLENRIREVVQERFFYEDKDEIDQITEMAIMLWEGEAVYHGAGNLPERLRKEMLSLIQEMVENRTPFSFQSLWKFRLKGMEPHIMTLVGTAIDEYKLEQDYQEFISVLRSFLASQSSTAEEVHLVYDTEFHFYNQQLQLISKQELMKSIDRKLMAESPIFIDSNTIAPLVSMAPKKVFLYTSEEDNGIIQTLRRIFEERIILEDISQFDERMEQHKNSSWM